MKSETTNIRQISVHELKAMLEGAEPLQLWDVRTDAERRLAVIPGARHLDPQGVEEIDDLDRGTLLVFHCHHGIRSQAAAEYFAAKGFTNLCNVTGGIEAWSLHIDPTVQRY